jgi:carboxymethylenebutenolidase
VFYGSGPDSKEAIAKIKCPVYGFYGANDNRINATIPKTQEMMKTAGKIYEPVTYDGAGHGFMRAGEDPTASEATPEAKAMKEANRKARDEAWLRWKQLLKKL